MLLLERTSLSKIGFHLRVNSVTGSGHRILSLSLYFLLDQLEMIQLSGSVILLSSNEVIHREKRKKSQASDCSCHERQEYSETSQILRKLLSTFV